MATQVRRAGGGLRGRVVPQTSWGWSCIGLAGAFVVFQALALLAISTGVETSAPAVAIPTSLGLISGSAALFAGIASIVWRKERSILVFLSAAVGLVVFAYWAGLLVSQFMGGGSTQAPPSSRPSTPPVILRPGRV
jgi:hypothetical protein